MTTPGRQAAIEVAAKACGSTIPWATLAIDAYEQALAEQPREEREIPTLGCRCDARTFLIGDRDGFCARCGLPAEAHFHLPAEQPRGEEERLRRALEAIRTHAREIGPGWPASALADAIESTADAALNAEENRRD